MKQPTPYDIIESSPTTTKPPSRSTGANNSSPASLNRTVSPPPVNPRRRLTRDPNTDSVVPPSSTVKSETAQVEAGEVSIEGHVSFFASRLLAASRPPAEGQPRLSHSDWLALYHRNLNERGHHFVVHQHDHPIAGTHYDLRLQCNAASSISFALPYGLPGNPNSRRLNRNAIETRVHNLWNHLIETASHETGTMLLWDTGEYEVLPYNTSGKSSNKDDTTATDGSDTGTDSELSARKAAEPEPQKLHSAFRNRKIKIRLHGRRLPTNYTISLRILKDNDRVAQPDAPAFKRRKKKNTANISAGQPTRRKSHPKEMETSSDSSSPPSPTSNLGLIHELVGEPTPQAPMHEISARTPSPTGSFDNLDPRSLKRKQSSSPKLKRRVSSLLRTASPPPPRRSNSDAASHQRPILPRSYSIANSDPQSQRPSQITRPNSLPLASPAAAPQPTSTLPTNPPISTQNHLEDSTTKNTEDIHIRLANAYPGAVNTINSIHQRRWFLSLDRAACGFRPTDEFAFGKRVWERPVLPTNRKEKAGGTSEKGGFKPFYVQGREFETSIVTGRLGAEVASDEGLIGYKPRGGWKGITD